MQRGGGVTLIVYFFVNFKIFELEHIVYMNVEEFLSKSQLPQGLKRGWGGVGRVLRHLLQITVHSI